MTQQSFTCDRQHCSFLAVLPLRRKCTSIVFYTMPPTNQCYIFTALSSAVFGFALCYVAFTTVLLYWGGFAACQSAKRPYFASVVSKGSQPSKRLNVSKADSVHQKLHPRCRDCTNPCSCTVLTIKTTQTLLVIKQRNTCISFSKNKKDSRESHIIHSINYTLDRTWKYI